MYYISNHTLEGDRRQPSRFPPTRSLRPASGSFITAQTNMQERTLTALPPGPSPCSGFNGCGVLPVLFWTQPGPPVLCPASIVSSDLYAILHILSCFSEEALASFERWEHRSSIICTRHWKMSHRVGNWVQGNPQVQTKSLTLLLLSTSGQCSEMRILQTQWEKALTIAFTEVSRSFI